MATYRKLQGFYVGDSSCLVILFLQLSAYFLITGIFSQCYQIPAADEVHKAPTKNSERGVGELSMGYCCRTLLQSEIHQQ